MFTRVADPFAYIQSSEDDYFEYHFCGSQRYWYVSATKNEPLVSLPTSALADFEFFKPHTQVCRFFVVDIDNDFWAWHLGDLPKDIFPHAIVETNKGAQCFWLVEPVALGGNARNAPISYAEDVYRCLRDAVGGDKALAPLTPAKCRNPLYRDADVRYSRRTSPYKLGELKDGLKRAGRWKTLAKQNKPRVARSMLSGEIVEGLRNETIFRACLGAGYRGEDYEALGEQLNSRCDKPLPDSELNTIFRSVARYVRTRGTNQVRTEEKLPEQIRDLMSELGRKGGSVQSEAQKQSFAKAREAGNAVKSSQAVLRKVQIQELKSKGYTQARIAEELGVSIKTVKRAWK